MMFDLVRVQIQINTKMSTDRIYLHFGKWFLEIILTFLIVLFIFCDFFEKLSHGNYENQENYKNNGNEHNISEDKTERNSFVKENVRKITFSSSVFSGVIFASGLLGSIYRHFCPLFLLLIHLVLNMFWCISHSTRNPIILFSVALDKILIILSILVLYLIKHEENNQQTVENVFYLRPTQSKVDSPPSPPPPPPPPPYGAMQ